MEQPLPPVWMLTDVPYAGATTTTEKKALIWVLRCSAIVSTLCSLFILWDVLVVRRLQAQRRRQPIVTATEGQQTPPSSSRSAAGSFSFQLVLLACVSVCDVILSVAMAFGTMPLPQEVDGRPTIFWGARGNNATCKAQGFFIQLGQTGLYYHLGMSTYNLLIIRYGFTQESLFKRHAYFHIPAVVGVALAFIGLPFYESIPFFCWIAVPPVADSYVPMLMFNTLPVWLSLLWSTVNFTLVYKSVRKTSRTSTIISSPGQQRSDAEASSSRQHASVPVVATSLERAVFWQCVSYGLAYFVPAFILTVAQLTAGWTDRIEHAYWWYIFLTLVVPLQGFFNFCVYMRPRLLQCCCRPRLLLQSGVWGDRTTDMSTYRSDNQRGVSTLQEQSDAPDDEEEEIADKDELSRTSDVMIEELKPAAILWILNRSAARAIESVCKNMLSCETTSPALDLHGKPVHRADTAILRSYVRLHLTQFPQTSLSNQQSRS